jgi:hypothetical protein
MRVTFLYAYEWKETWSTPYSLILAFQDKGWEVDIVSIGSNKTGIYTDYPIQSWLKTKPETDIVLFLDWGRFDSPFLNKELLPNSFWIQESGDDPQNYLNNSGKSNRFHLTFTPDWDSYLKYKEKGTNCIWRTHWCCPRTQFPLDITPEYTAVSTRGHGSSPILDSLTKYGEGSFGNKNGMESKEHTEFLNSGLMVIQHSRWGEITRRIFEGMACRKLVLTDRLNNSKKLQELFEEGKEIIFYDSLEDLVNKIHYYTEHEDQREQIATAGMNKVLKYHTSDVVVEQLINEYNKWKNNTR